jgi:hypothetical protein
VATKKPWRPFYDVFLERVIQIEAVQCYRAAVTDHHTAYFFELGRIPGVFGDFLWSLHAPEAFPWGPLGPGRSEKPAPVSLPMQRAWDAALAAWWKFIAELANSEMIASGMHPVSGIRTEMDPFEWSRTESVLDVRNGDLIEGWYGRPPGKHTVRWSAIVLQVADQPQKLGRIDWDAEWNEDVARRERGELPNEKAYLREVEERIKERYGVTSVDGADLRRFRAALYRGDPVRPRKK